MVMVSYYHRKRMRWASMVDLTEVSLVSSSRRCIPRLPCMGGGMSARQSDGGKMKQWRCQVSRSRNLHRDPAAYKCELEPVVSLGDVALIRCMNRQHLHPQTLVASSPCA